MARVRSPSLPGCEVRGASAFPEALDVLMCEALGAGMGLGKEEGRLGGRKCPRRAGLRDGMRAAWVRVDKLLAAAAAAAV